MCLLFLKSSIRLQSMVIPTKTALSHLTRLLATDFALKKIPVRVNSLSPGLFPSEMTGSVDEVEEYAKEQWFAEKAIPLGRTGR